MAKKIEENKKTTKPKKTTKKEVVKKETVKKEETVIKEVKVKKENKVLNGLKKFFNNPVPLFVAFIAIICVLLLFIYRNTTVSKIYVGNISEGGLQVGSVHYFSNSDMNYFYGSPAIYDGEHSKTKVFNYEIGYYVIDNSKNYIPFCTRSKKLEKAVDVKTIIDEMSAWDFAESNIANYYFTPEVVSNLDKIHFVFKGSSDKDSDEADVYIDYEVKLSEITKR